MAQNKPARRKPDLEVLFSRMKVEMKEIEQMLQNNSKPVQPLEDMLLNYELVYSLLDKIAHDWPPWCS
jgi:hypothetical protein